MNHDSHVYTLTVRPITDAVQGIGVVQADREIDVYPEVAGTVARVHVKEGDRFHAGDLLIEIDNPVYHVQLSMAEAELREARAYLEELERGTRPETLQRLQAERDAARAAYTLAEREYQRVVRLYREGVVSQQALDNARARRDEARQRLEAAEAAYAEAHHGPRKEEIERARARVARAHASVTYWQTLLDKTRIRAPWDGIVLNVWTHPGDVVHPQVPRPLLRIADLNRYPEIEVDYIDAFRVRAGQRVIFWPENQPERQRTGVVEQLYAYYGKKRVFRDQPAEMIDRKVRIVRVRPDRPLDWNIGLTLEARIITFQGRALAIPREWVRNAYGRYFVWRRRGTHEEKVEIHPTYTGTFWIVVPGTVLRPGDTLVRPDT